MYSVETEVAALDEVAALPAQALPAYAELMTLLEVAPWSGALTTCSAQTRTCAPTRSAKALTASRSILFWSPTGGS
jgi:hypothetical protein